MRRYNFAIKELKKHSPYDTATYEKITKGDGGLYSFLEESILEDGSADDFDEDLFGDVVQGMDNYIRHLCAIPAFKQKRWVEFKGWLQSLDVDISIKIRDSIIDDYLVEPAPIPTAVAVVKALQAESLENGKTKSELAYELRVSNKTIQKTLHSLDSSLDEKSKIINGIKKNKKEIQRFAGQRLNVRIEHGSFVEKPFARDRDDGIETDEQKNISAERYYTPESCHPIAMQLNAYQVGTMLKGLQMAHDSDVSYNSLYMAINIWSQLSEYCQGRIINHFRPEDKKFHQFIDQVEQEVNEATFIYESDMLNDPDETIGAKLNLAYKGSWQCNVKRYEDDEVLRNCRILYETGNYYICRDDERYIANKNNIEDIFIYRD